MKKECVMRASEEDDHTFVIRIWWERREMTGSHPVWRGVIQHVLSSNEQAIQKLEDISDFIVPYLPRPESNSDRAQH